MLGDGCWVMGGGFYHQHSEHLSSVGIFADVGMVSNVLLHFAGSQLTERMWLVAERIGKPFGAANVGMQWV